MPARRRKPLAREEPAELQVAATNGSIVTDSHNLARRPNGPAGAAVAASLPERTGTALLEAARGAFTEAVGLTAMVSAALAIMAAIVTATVVRGDRSASHR